MNHVYQFLSRNYPITKEQEEINLLIDIEYQEYVKKIQPLVDELQRTRTAQIVHEAIRPNTEEENEKFRKPYPAVPSGWM
jgi:hypothetical protein